MDNKVNNKESNYPSVDLAYEFVKPSYDWMVGRFEAADKKIQNLLTFAVSITVALPLFTKAIFDEVNFSSGWFFVILIVFVLIVIIGTIGKRMGAITLVHPEVLYSKYLHYSKWEFRKNVIFWAAKHFKANKKLLDKKSFLLDIMTYLLILEVIFAAFWVFSAS